MNDQMKKNLKVILPISLPAGWCGTLNLAINCKSFVLQMEIRAIEEERKRQNEAFIEAQVNK